MVTINGVNFDVPEYYNKSFKGRTPKYCPKCKRKMEYDGWGSDGVKLDEYWICKKCRTMLKNPE
jgi:hypothetical protein